MHHGQVMGRCAPKTGIEPFSAPVEQVMTTESYARAGRAIWVVDNGSSHSGARSIRRMSEALANATLVHRPGFENRHNQTAQPFDWPLARQDLKRYLARLAAHETAI